jgi:hypothetical protein
MRPSRKPSAKWFSIFLEDYRIAFPPARALELIENLEKARGLLQEVLAHEPLGHQGRARIAREVEEWR